MRNSLILGLLGTFVMTVTVLSAQGPLVRPKGPLSPAVTIDAATRRTGQGLISGKATNADMRPLPDVTVRLRNLETNQIEQIAKSDLVGEFTFVVQPQIPYVVEIADRAGAIVAVGDVITAQAGDVASAIVTIPSRVPALAAAFGETAGSVISAATGTGLTVLEAANAPLVSPEK